jgi:chemotaxis protein methyltransferase CheR
MNAFPPLTDRDYRYFQTIIRAEAGIQLGETKRALLTARLSKRLQQLGLRSFREYKNFVVEHQSEVPVLLERICTHETRFFREAHHFEFLTTQLYPQLLAGGPRTIRAWSAGCSTGEEPFSLAMALLERFPPQAGWRIDILATDLSTQALAKARAALWPIERAADIPKRLLKAFMLRGIGSDEGKMSAGREIRDVVHFARVNLHGNEWPGGSYDLVFCRNVLIYFGHEEKVRALSRLAERLAPAGYLFLGHAETIAGIGLGLRAAIPTVYGTPAAVAR